MSKFRANIFWIAAKGQLISKENYQAMNSSKKQTNEFNFTTMILSDQLAFVCFFGKKLKTQKRHF